MSNESAGIIDGGGQTLNYFIAACTAISVYNSVEVLGLAVTTFTRYNTLYFWAIVTCAMGCIWFACGFLDIFYQMYKNVEPYATVYRPLFILTLGWYGMVTGFALVMYSRLHLVMVPKKYIFYVKCFMIYNVIFSHFPTSVLTFGTFINETEDWASRYGIMEKIQMTMFCIQEVILGALYLHYTRKMRFNKKVTKLVRQTLYVNALVLVLDISMLIIEYVNLYRYQIMLKVVVYSIKLKLEFFILNILTRSLEKGGAIGQTGYGGGASKDLVSGGEKHMSAVHGNKEVIPATPSDAGQEDTKSAHDSQSRA